MNFQGIIQTQIAVIKITFVSYSYNFIGFWIKNQTSSLHIFQNLQNMSLIILFFGFPGQFWDLSSLMLPQKAPSLTTGPSGNSPLYLKNECRINILLFPLTNILLFLLRQ